MTTQMEALKKYYEQYLTAMPATHEGTRSVDMELTGAPEPFADRRTEKTKTPAKGHIFKLGRRRW